MAVGKVNYDGKEFVTVQNQSEDGKNEWKFKILYRSNLAMWGQSKRKLKKEDFIKLLESAEEALDRKAKLARMIILIRILAFVGAVTIIFFVVYLVIQVLNSNIRLV